MLSFDALWAAAALLLFLPFHLWLRHRRPVDHHVGGLQPFQKMAQSGSAHSRRRPWSYWLLLLAFLGTTFALMGPRGGGLEPLLIVDQSLSASLQAAPPPSVFHGETRTMGSADEVVTHREIFAALGQVQPGRDVTVWTDLPEPMGLPDTIDWQDARVAEQALAHGAILQAKAIDRGTWLVHWAQRKGNDGMLVASMDEVFPLEGTRGVRKLTPQGSGRTISLSGQGKGRKTFQSFALKTIGVVVEDGMHPDWLAVFQAIDPNLFFVPIVNEAQQGIQGPYPALSMDGNAQPRPQAWDDIPWTEAPTPDLIASLARSWPALAGEPRDSREVLPILEAPTFPQNTMAALQKQQGQPPKWMTLLVLLSGLCATAGWLGLPKPAYSSSAV